MDKIPRTIRGKRDTINRAYLAGFFDGEGWVSIFLSNSSGGKKYPQLRIGVANTYRPVVEMFKERYGASNIYEETPPKGRLIYRWAATGTNANNMLRDLVPFLTVKQRQAKIGLHYYAHRANNDVDWVNKLIQRIRELNGNSAHISHPQRLSGRTSVYSRSNRSLPYKLDDAKVRSHR